MAKLLKRKIIQTEDGSSTFFLPKWNEHYHSVHGARQESEHIFIKSGLEALPHTLQNKPIHILEIGFGTGLNTLLTFENQKEKTIYYTTIEKFPLNEEEVKLLNYTQNSEQQIKNIFQKIHQCKQNKFIQLNKNFYFKKLQCDLINFKTTQKFNLIYFDAFAPKLQPELWSKEIFSKLYKISYPNALLLTYSAQGQIRRNMKESGFLIKKLAGPPGKREITRAVKKV